MSQRIEQILSEMQREGLPRRLRQALVLPALQRVQREFGYLPEDALSHLARLLNVSESHVYGVATFYSQFRFTPAARNSIAVCCGTACHVRGSAMLMGELRRRLGINPGETTPDLSYSLDTLACFGSCSLAPVVVMNGKVRGRMTRTRLTKAIDQLEGGAAAPKKRARREAQ